MHPAPVYFLRARAMHVSSVIPTELMVLLIGVFILVVSHTITVQL